MRYSHYLGMTIEEALALPRDVLIREIRLRKEDWERDVAAAHRIIQRIREELNRTTTQS